MNDDPNERIFTRASRAPWREILSHLWSRRRDRALVLRDGGGRYHLSGRPGGPEEPEEPEPWPPGLPGSEGAEQPIRRGGYTDAFLVDLTEQVDTRAVGLPTVYGTESVDLYVAWWVHDPVQVVRSRTLYGWTVVRDHLTTALRHLGENQAVAGGGLGAPEVIHVLGPPQRVEGAGLSYRVFDVRPRETGEELLLGEAEQDAVRYSWTADRRGEYEFCVQALRNGPVSLAALWLLRRPDEVSAVLDWVVGHQDLLSQRTDWQDEMAVLLGTLTEQERQEMSRLLRDRLRALGRPAPAAWG
ncbi:hypothetical protein [Streptomyces sp. NPDC047097]|uniref:hypothetical protein n=1 Tax=Streptomyces sp. NPDC047097 TaxID=3155260 RepID=UPI0033CCB2D0